MRIQSFAPLALVLALGVLGCPKKDERPDATPQPNPSGERVPAVAKEHPLYARVEGTSFKNDCTADEQCKKGGCSAEVCSSEEGVNTTCEMPAEGFPQGANAACGCVASECIWYRGPASADDRPKQGAACPEGQCAEGLTCLEYYGIAGPNGPKFKTCEIPCPTEKSTCPSGQSCTTIADGPGRVCRAMGSDQPAQQ